MPKITDAKVEKVTVPKYNMVPTPQSLIDKYREVRIVCNLQTCTCDHDRCCHSGYIGVGEKTVSVIDVPYAGRCGVKGCKCGMFVFSSTSSPEGKKNREKEKKLSKVYPPQSK